MASSLVGAVTLWTETSLTGGTSNTLPINWSEDNFATSFREQTGNFTSLASTQAGPNPQTTHSIFNIQNSSTFNLSIDFQCGSICTKAAQTTISIPGCFQVVFNETAGGVEGIFGTDSGSNDVVVASTTAAPWDHVDIEVNITTNTYRINVNRGLNVSARLNLACTFASTTQRDVLFVGGFSGTDNVVFANYSTILTAINGTVPKFTDYGVQTNTIYTNTAVNFTFTPTSSTNNTFLVNTTVIALVNRSGAVNHTFNITIANITNGTNTSFVYNCGDTNCSRGDVVYFRVITYDLHNNELLFSVTNQSAVKTVSSSLPECNLSSPPANNITNIPMPRFILASSSNDTEDQTGELLNYSFYFNGLLNRTGNPDVNMTPATFVNGTHNWTGQVFNKVGNSTNCTSVRTFTVDNVPPEVTIVSNSSTSSSFTFNFSVNETVNYTIRYGTTPNNLFNIQSGGSICASSCVDTLSGLIASTNYYYGIYVSDLVGNGGNLSTVQNITTAGSGGSSSPAGGGDGGSGRDLTPPPPPINPNLQNLSFAIKTDQGAPKEMVLFISAGGVRSGRSVRIVGSKNDALVNISCVEVDTSKGFCKYVTINQSVYRVPANSAEITIPFVVNLPPDAKNGLSKYKFAIVGVSKDPNRKESDEVVIDVRVSFAGKFFETLAKLGQSKIYNNKITGGSNVTVPIFLIIIMASSMIAGLVIFGLRNTDYYKGRFALAFGGFITTTILVLVTI